MCVNVRVRVRVRARERVRVRLRDSGRTHLYVERAQVQSEAAAEPSEQLVADRVHQIVVGLTAVGVSQPWKTAQFGRFICSLRFLGFQTQCLFKHLSGRMNLEGILVSARCVCSSPRLRLSKVEDASLANYVI